MKTDPSENALLRKVEVITIVSGVVLCALSLGAYAWTRGELRPLGFLTMAALGLVVAIVGVVELRKVRPPPQNK